MPPWKPVAVDPETHGRLRMLASRMGVSVSGLLRILASSLTVEEEGGEVIVFISLCSPARARKVRVLDSRVYSRLLGRLGELERLNAELKRMIRELRERLRRLEEEKRRLERDNAFLTKLLSLGEHAAWIAGEPLIVRELRSHGLLTLAQQWLRRENRMLEDYADEDTLQAVLAHKQEILNATTQGEAREKKKITWIL